MNVNYSENFASSGSNNGYGNIGNLILPTLSVSNLTNPAESNTNGAFRLTLDQSFFNDITVNYNIAGTATQDTDYTIPQTIVIPADQTSVEIPVIVTDDIRFDPNETVILTLAAGTPNFYTIGAASSATLTLDDNEPEVSITAGTTPTEANEVSGTFNINLTRPAPEGGLEIQYTVAGTAGKDDYIATLNGNVIPSGSLITPAGATTTSINIKPVDDSLIEGQETLKFTLIEPANLERYAVKDDATEATLSITDNEKLPIVKLGKIGNPSEQGPTSGSFSIFLADPETGEPLENPPLKSDGQALELEVSYEISGTANNGADYSEILTSPITIPAGKTSAALPVETLEDLIDENDETVTITLKDIKTEGAIYTIDTTPATLNLTDNDTVGITVSPINGSTHEQGGEAGFTVQLNSQPKQPVTFNFTSSDTTEGQLPTPSITFDSSNWNQLQTVKVKGVDDSERDGDRTYAIQTTISSDDVNYSTLNLADIPVTNVDDETENVLISQSNGSTEISEAGVTDSFEVVLTGFPINDIVVNVTPDSQTDLGNGLGQPIALNFTPETATTPQIVTVKAVDDDVVEGKHQSKISYIANSIDPLYAGLKGEINAAIVDNDNPTVSVKSAGNGSEQSIIPGVFQLTLDHAAPSEGLTVNYTISGVATPGGDYTAVGLNTVSKTGSVYIAPGQTGANLNITPIQDLMTETGGETVTLQLETGAGYNIGTATPANVIITDDDVAGVRVLETGNGTQVVEQNATPPNINKADTYQISLTSSPAVGEIVTITPNYNAANLQLLDANQNPITEITFDSTNWNQSKTITVVGLNDNQPGTLEQLITHSTSSTDPTSSYNTGLEIDGKPLPNVTVAITEPTYNSGEIADGLGLLLERIAESLRQMFKNTSVPIIGSLSGSEPAFIDTIKNNIVNAVKSTANLTQDKLKTLLTDQLKTIFPDVNVISSSFPEDVSFSIDLGKRYATAANLSKDFGLPGLGLEVEGQAEASFEYDLDLKFGYHQDFGFYVDTAGTKLSADALVDLNDNFNAKATLGFLELNVANGAEDKAQGGTKKTQASLDANFALKDIDLDGSGNLIADSGDGNRLTLTELKGFNQLRQTNQATLENLFDLDIEAGAQVGLNAKTTILGSSAIPSFNFEVAGQFDILKVDGFKVTGPQTPQIDFQNVAIDIGSFVSNFAKPILEQVDKVLQPFRPLVDVLIQDTKLLSKLGLAGVFDKKWPIPNGGDGQVSTLELADVILKVLGNELPPKVYQFLDTFIKVDNFVKQVNSLPAGETILIPLGNFKLPKLQDLSKLSESEVDTIAQNTTSLKADFEQIFQTATDTAKKQAAEYLKGLTADLSLPSLESVLGLQQNVTLLETELNNLLQTTPDSAKKQAIQFLKDFADRLPSSQFADFSKLNLSEIEQQASDVKTELDKIIQNADTSSKKATTEFTKSFTYGDGNTASLFDIPLLKDPKKAMGLLLGQDVSLFTFDVPEVAFNVGVRKTFPIWRPIRGLLEGKFGASADFAIGMDTFGLRQWKAKDFASNEAYRILDGFYISDREKPDGTGADVAEIKLNATVAAGAGIDIFLASGYLKGGVEGLFNLDLVDKGEANKTDDGRIHAISEIVPRFDDLLSLIGEVNAFLGAEVKVFGETVYDKHFATFNLAKFKIGNSSIGKVQDGYISGARVFLDANFNGIQDFADLNSNGIRDFEDLNSNGIRDTYSAPDLDTGEIVQLLEVFSEPFSEPSTITSPDGSYDLNIFNHFDTNGNGNIDADEGRMIVINGVDTSTFLPQIVPLATTPTATIASPLTLLASQGLTPDFDRATTQVKNAFSLPSALDLLTDIPTDVDIKVLGLEIQLQNLIIAATRTLSEAPFIGLQIESAEVKNQAGLLYLDRNGNGQFDTAEPEVISDRTQGGIRFLDLNGNKQFDSGEFSSPVTTAEIAKAVFQTVATLIQNGETPNLSDETVVKTLLENAISGLTQQDPSLTLDADILTATVAEIIGKNPSVDSILANTALDEATARQQIVKPWVFFDANYNKVQDANEPFAYQASDGTNELKIPVAQFDANGNGRLDPNEGETLEVEAFESVELATGYSQLVTNPFETLVRLLAEPVDPEATQTQVKTALGLPNVDLYNFDPLKTIAEGNPDGLIVFSKQAQIYNTLVQLSQFLSSSSGEATNRILEELTKQINQPNVTLNLSDPTPIQALIQVINPNISANTAAGVANIIVAGNIRIEQLVSDSTLNLVQKATEIAKVQQVVQGKTATDLQKVGAGTLSIEQAIAAHTDEALNTQIQASTAQDPTFQLDLINNNPTAEADANITTLEDTPITINVLENDTETDSGDSLTVTMVGSLAIDDGGQITAILPETSQGGTLEVSEDGKSITYTPAVNYFGEDSFFYLIKDSKGSVANAEVAINVTSVDDAPERITEIPDQLNVQQGQPFTLDVSPNFSDPDGDVLVFSAAGLPTGLNIDPVTGIISGTPTVGTVSPLAMAIAVTATDTSGATVSDQFDLSVNALPQPTLQPTPSVTPTPTTNNIPNDDCICDDIAYPNLNQPNAVENTILGVSGIQIGIAQNDEFLGSNNGNIFDAKSGNDNLYGGASNDIFNGNQGNDFITGGKGDDILYGDEGNDIVLGELGNDLIFGGKGNDLLHGREGNDIILGDKDDDFIDGGKDNDVLYGGKGNDIMLGSQGDDYLFGQLGSDTICGGVGNDLISGNKGADILGGCEGNDTLYGGEDNDTLTGCQGDDILYGDLGNNSLIGGSGNDIFALKAGGGFDIIADFTLGQDLIGLSGGLSFGQLAITQNTQGTLIKNLLTGEELGVMIGVSANAITSANFRLI